VTADGATLSDGTAIPSRTVLSALGQSLVVLPGTEALPRTPRGLIATDETLHVRGHADVWAGGDAAEVMHVSGSPCPANALWAIKHGHWVGGNIAATLTGKRLKRFTYRGLGQAASLGIGRGAAELYGVQFTGWIGWTLRFFFFLYFQPSRRQAVRVFLDWLTLPFLGRYLTISDEWRHPAEEARRLAAE
jgi:NADH dehydrogenase